MLGRIRRATRIIKDAEAPYTSAPRRPQRSIARDAVLALLALDGGRSRLGVDHVVAAALMGELVQERRLTVSGEGRKTRVEVRDKTPTGDPELDDALLTVAAGMFGRRVKMLIGFMPAPSVIGRRMVEAGLVTERPHRVLGLFPTTRHDPTPAARSDELVAAVRGVLLGRTVPDERTALLVSALLVVVPPRDWVDKREVKAAKARVQEIFGRLREQELAVVAAVIDARASSQSGYSGA